MHIEIESYLSKNLQKVRMIYFLKCSEESSKFYTLSKSDFSGEMKKAWTDIVTWDFCWIEIFVLHRTCDVYSCF